MTTPPARCRIRRRPDLLAIALACCLLPIAARAGDAVDPGAPSDEVYLEVTLNQTQKPALFRFVVRDGHLYASPSTLRELGLHTSGDASTGGLLPVEHDGIVVAYDAAKQRVAITAPLLQLDVGTAQLDARAQADAPSPTPLGILFSYDADVIRSGNGGNAVLAPSVQVFGLGNATLESNGIVRSTSSGNGWHSSAVRLDTRLRWTFPGRALEVILGDTTTSGPDWSRQTRMGGLHIGTNYASLQPFRVLSPGPVFSGESAVPSNVELYVNGIKQYEGQAPVGRFVVSGAPSMEGLGNAQLVVTDVFGRSRTIDVPFYGTQRLLAPGLDDWSLTLGRVRLDYGSRSASYAPDTALDASWRRGITSYFTGEGHAEATRGLREGGLGGAWLLGRAGVMHAAWAASSAGALSGSQSAWGYQWSNGHFSVGFDSIRTHGDYRDLAAVATGFLPPRVTDSANIGVASALLGSFNFTYAQLQYVDQPRSRLAGAYWSRTIGRGWFVNAGGNIDLDHHAQRSFSLGVTVLLDGQRQASASVQRSGSRTYSEADLTKQARVNGDIGWRLQARHDSDNGNGGLAEATWLTHAVELTAGIAQDGDNRQYHAAAHGSVVWMGRSLFASRQVIDGFALVDAGYPNIPVKLENRPYGTTNRNGQLILTPLFPFQRNRVSIDPTALPANVRVPLRDKVVVPGASGAAKVSFDVTPVHAAIVILHDAAGHALPMGGNVHRAEATNDGDDTIVGYDGEVYLEGLSAHNALEVEMPDGRCIARFDYTAGDADIPRIGPVTCGPENAK
ncbi:fimbria/pilus outer membrane usher protein [Solilutibacter silvestris]|uniref:Type VII secretion system (T7SS), usher protein n=1 Tax=Solilutibacter silvestris TaxID=1645665 RepID=A0A2K1Q3D6_9GAMM|nr:fimbria/pilus outer membrane usher protein [Lysobacter silvestris]PNS09555.1 Type VII secretion system (T7SS), usher protein [Lysobacter silvestris]